MSGIVLTYAARGFMGRRERITETLVQPKYLALGLAGIIIYSLIYIYTIKLTTGSFEQFLYVMSNYKMTYVLTAIPLTVITAVLFGITTALTAKKVADLREMKKSGFAGAGLFLSLLASGCPSCALGVFPAVASLFGISATLASLPFGGRELQVLSILLFLASIYFLSADSTCEIKK